MERQTVYDSVPLMLAIAKWAGMEEAGIRKMVLVLAVDELPTLYVESLVRAEVDAPDFMKDLGETPKPDVVVSDKLPLIDTTTMQNEEWRTMMPKPNPEKESL